MARTALIYHPDALLHDTGEGHPERRARLESIVQHLKNRSLWDEVLHLQPQPAPRRALLRAHSPAHLDQVAALERVERPTYVCQDTAGSSSTHRIALLAAGAPLTAIDALLAGRADHAFCCMRPPGHHAEVEQIMGFCFFNNAAVAAHYLRAECGCDKVAIIDWDVHHGNGTQHIFEADGSVFFCSIHQSPLYPGTGAADERGLGAGRGQTLNIPVPAGSTDADYLRHFADTIIPAIDQFQPDFILLSAGFDAHRSDPLGQILLSAEGYGKLTELVLQLATRHCEGRLVSLLEGGYDLEATAASVAAHLSALLAA